MNVCRIKDCHIYLQTNIFLRSQILFLLVFLTRYMDVFTHFISMYNTSIKIFFIISTTTNIYLVFVKYAGTISSDMDTFRYVLVSLKIEWKWAEIFQNRVSYFGSSSTCSFCQPWLQLPRGFPRFSLSSPSTPWREHILTPPPSCLLSRWSWYLQVLWTFSVYLESVAIIPQLNLSNKVLFIIIIFSINLIIIITLIISPPQIVATYKLNSTQLHPHYHLDWSSSQ